METNTGAVLSLLLLLIFYVYRKLIKHRNFFNERGIAFIKPSIIFGNMFESVLELENHEVLLKRLYNEFKREKLFGIFMFLRPVIIVKDVELIRQISNSPNFPSRDACSIDDILNKSMYHLEGSQWIKMKEITAPFFNESALKAFYPNISLCADEFMRVFDKKYSSNTEELQQQQQPLVVDIREAFEEFLANVISIVVLGNGIVYGEQSAVYKIAKQIERDFTSLRGGLKIILIKHFPLLAKLLGVRVFSQCVYDFLRDHVTDEIDRRKRRKADDRHDFVQFLLKSNDSFDDASKSAQVLSFFVSGFKVVSKLFQACCFELARNDQIQNGLYEEMRNENEFILNYKNLKLLDKFILEALRKWPPIDSINRVCGENCTIELKTGEKYKFFKGDFIKIPITLVHNDHELFDDPNYFNPHRVNLNSIFPFGLGARACPCSQIAVFQVKFVLFKIMRKYTIIQCPKTPPFDECKFSSDPNATIYVGIKLRAE